jgi:hypothetical protein
MSPASAPSSDMQAAIEKARAVKRAHEGELLSRANVVGVGIGFRRKGGRQADQVALVVMVKQKLPTSLVAPDDVIPAEIDGVPIDVQEVGEISAQL